MMVVVDRVDGKKPKLETDFFCNLYYSINWTMFIDLYGF